MYIARKVAAGAGAGAGAREAAEAPAGWENDFCLWFELALKQWTCKERRRAVAKLEREELRGLGDLNTTCWAFSFQAAGEAPRRPQAYVGI